MDRVECRDNYLCLAFGVWCCFVFWFKRLIRCKHQTPNTKPQTPNTKHFKMIIDTINNAHKYFSVHPLFERAFQYITTNDIKNIEVGKADIAEGLKAIISDNEGKTAETSLSKFECHNKNIDIQLCIRGNETIGWKPREKCVTPNGDFNEEKDVQFFHDQPDMFFKLTDGQFAIFFPEDVHAPMIGEGLIKKLVVKVRM